jgi:hypothetical protein
MRSGGALQFGELHLHQHREFVIDRPFVDDLAVAMWKCVTPITERWWPVGAPSEP